MPFPLPRRREAALAALLLPAQALVQTALAQTAPVQTAPPPDPETIEVTGTRHVAAPLHPVGQTRFGADRTDFGNTPQQNAADLLATVPGVTTIGGNGPRDVSISVRGSNDRQSYGLRNVQVLEDGFPMTQPDGTARADLIDPHAYERVDVVEGPASALYGNYATGGALLFATRDGADIQGVQLGSDFGSRGYYNQYVTAGVAGAGYDLMLFGSDVRGRGAIANSNYDTSTESAKLRFDLGAQDSVTIKVVNNVTDTMLPVRLSLAQYLTNPYQKGCTALAAAGCGSVGLYANGLSGATVSESPEQAGLGRFDRRTLTGIRWEHSFNSATTWRTQFAYDDRVIDQPTSSTSYRGPYTSYNATSDITHVGTLFGRRLTSFFGVNYNDEDIRSEVYNVMAGRGATLGGLVQTTNGHQWNAGARFRELLALSKRWAVVAGLGGEHSGLDATERNITYASNGQGAASLIPSRRSYGNIAPEVAVIFTPGDQWRWHVRFASGYGTPQTSNLFITPQGTFGNNTQLKAQSNDGVDLGVTWQPDQRFRVTAAGFYEFFHNELVTQSAGVNLQSYTFNAPASEHRGVELGAELVPLPQRLPGLRFTANYLYDNQIYTDYTETLSGSGTSRSFDRDGNRIPGVVPQNLDARLYYDQKNGMLEGVGGFLEMSYRSDYLLDNANLLKAPGVTLWNLSLHYDPPKRRGWLHRLHLFCEIENLTGQSYVASASNVTDVLQANGQEAGEAVLATRTGSIYAGQPRTVYGGVTVKF